MLFALLVGSIRSRSLQGSVRILTYFLAIERDRHHRKQGLAGDVIYEGLHHLVGRLHAELPYIFPLSGG